MMTRVDEVTLHRSRKALEAAGLVEAVHEGGRAHLIWNRARASHIARICKELAGAPDRV